MLPVIDKEEAYFNLNAPQNQFCSGGVVQTTPQLK
jgi:hypothetical protein